MTENGIVDPMGRRQGGGASGKGANITTKQGGRREGLCIHFKDA
jgi:hypothetical protein